ncbi:hypothetical protein DW756_11010 [Dorea formicigenerans]|uniref:Uncharacterized protein n=1 Tax=Dorea formicigenerans TaxID=39486 RepID=A0A412MD04_9FIRM|nr:hypothetical protein DWX53_08055 [Dorea formicigenerans]RHE26771.1 hypothetical protein DW756_11010 [Dorea formicigenerans]
MFQGRKTATIVVQAVNNMYDFYQFTDNKKYTTMVKRESIVIVIFAIIAIMAAIVALLGISSIMESIWIKLIVILFVTIPIGVGCLRRSRKFSQKIRDCQLMI